MKRAAFAALSALAADPAHALDRDCFRRLRLAQGAGFIKSYEPLADGLDVVVAEDIWNSLPTQSREGMVRNLNCALRRDGEAFVRIRIHSDRNGGIIGQAWGNDLAVPGHSSPGR